MTTIFGKRVRDAQNRNVNFWFHTPRRDCIAPRDTITEFSNVFLECVQRKKLRLHVNEYDFRKNMCEALCTMYLANKLETTWKGPLTSYPRPNGWSSKYESVWADALSALHITYETWEYIWSQIESADWEKTVPYWRDSIESICVKYVMVNDEFVRTEMGDVARYAGGHTAEDGEE